jgi:ferredoxin
VQAIYWAQLVREANNPYDPFAVAVHISGEKVGHLSKGDAQAYSPVLDRLGATGRPVAVRCDVRYGWNRPGEERGHCRLRVYMDTPQKQAELLGPDAAPVPDKPERPYANTACPTCGVELDPPPEAKRKCPSCKEVIYVRSFPDGRRHLLNEATLADQEAAWGKEREAKEKAKRQQWRKDTARENRAELAELRREGAEEIEIVVDDEACEACRTLADKGWPIKEVPSSPTRTARTNFAAAATGSGETRIDLPRD